jgi:caffeoyl-CoA O-methyltransferase
MEIVNPLVESYIDNLQRHRHPVYREMERRAKRSGFPIIGPQVGALLAVLTRLGSARRILELGSGFGYSALWFAEALPEEGSVICTDFSSQHKAEAEQYFRRAGQQKKLRFMVGEALQILEELEAPFDIILNDIDKQDYPRTLPLVLPRLRSNGLFITDNTLWYGSVIQEDPSSASTLGVRRFNAASSHPGWSHRGSETLISAAWRSFQSLARQSQYRPGQRNSATAVFPCNHSAAAPVWCLRCSASGQ